MKPLQTQFLSIKLREQSFRCLNNCKKGLQRLSKWNHNPITFNCIYVTLTFILRQRIYDKAKRIKTVMSESLFFPLRISAESQLHLGAHENSDQIPPAQS